MITIRPATPDDAHRLAELRYEFRASLSSPVEPRDAFVERCATWMRNEIASARWHVWVADRDGELVGQLWLLVIDKLPNPVAEPARHAYISNLFVGADARGGVGTALLEAALDYARAQHVDRIVLWPTSRSRSLYQRYGFTAAGDVFEKRL